MRGAPRGNGGLLLTGAGARRVAGSKYAIIGLAKSAALDHVTFSVPANAVLPGNIEVPKMDRSTGGDPANAGIPAESRPI